MKAVGLYEHLPIEAEKSLLDLEVDKPGTPKGYDLLVEILAVSVNPVDTKQRKAEVPRETSPRILGYDAVGVVRETGEKAGLFKPGDEVYFAGDVTRQGSNAEYILIDERIVGNKPKSLTIEEAAGMPLTTITAWEALFERLGIEEDKDEGKSILIINGAGGVGSVAIQLATYAGLEVISTASREETAAWIKEMGAKHVVNHREDLEKQLQDLGFANGVDYILCLHDTYQYWDTMQKLIRPQGKICSIVELSDPVKMNLLKDKSATFVYEFMFTRSKYQTPDLIRQHEILQAAGALFDMGKLKSTVKKVLHPINAATMREAHQEVERGKMIGKLVVKGFD